jgi:hypothetical protein
VHQAIGASGFFNQFSIVTVDNEGRVTAANPFAERLLQFYEDGLQGYTYLEDPKER